ncbi:MAG: hypothetical protein HQK59_05130 [Deltaproteobacteria bacterium]|nr:hypothetical protein [Deltaproteobacteria bacterium]
METIVCDTSALVRLYKGGALNCLISLFEKIYIPIAVKNECLDEPVMNAIKRPPFEILEVKELVDLGQIGMGEREVVSLAIEIEAKTILTDDRRAVKKLAQRNFKLDILESTDVLILAKQAGLINSAKKILETMRANDENITEKEWLDTLKAAGEI